MNTITVLIIVVVSSIISGFLSWGINENKKWTLIVSAIIIGAVMSYLGTINLYMHNQFNKVENLVDSYDNSLSNANNAISSLDDNNKRLTKMIFTDKIEQIDLKLNKIFSENEIIIEKSDILNIWTFLIENAQVTFYASNLVPPDDWQYVNADNFGIKPQLAALNKGVDVKRVNFYDPTLSDHENGIKKVYQTQKEAGIPSDIKSIVDVYDNFTYNSIIQGLTTADVVLVDNEILLLTMVDRNYKMKYAVVCFDENRIKSARHFFQKLFENFPIEESDH